MRRRRLYSLLIVVCLFLCSTRPTWAYYDDVHYALTFYIAREMGFTPWQSARIASACVSVDYGVDSEPVQMDRFFVALSEQMRLNRPKNLGANGAADISLEAIQRNPLFLKPAVPQWKFHAFRDVERFPGTALAPSAPAADAAIHAQEEELWKDAIRLGNPGIFLHFYQDEGPHRYYGTVLGHWVLPPGQSLPMGSTSDWLSYQAEKHPGSDVQLVQNTVAKLSEFLEEVVAATSQPGAPKADQHLRPIDETMLTAWLTMLNEANPYPASISTWQRVAELKGGHASDEGHLFETGPIAGPTEEEARNIDGPDLEKAVEILNRALALDGLLQGGIGIPRSPIYYQIDTNAAGFQARFPSTDATVIVGKLNVKIVEKSQMQNPGDSAVEPRSIQVKLLSVPAGTGEQEYELASKTESPQGSSSQEVAFTGVPVGLIKAEAEAVFPDGSTQEVAKTVMVDKQNNDLTLEVLDLEKGKLLVSAIDSTTGQNLPGADVLVKGGGKSYQAVTSMANSGALMEVPVTNGTSEDAANFIAYQIIVTKSGYRPGRAGPITVSTDPSHPTQVLVQLQDLAGNMISKSASVNWAGTYTTGTTGAYYTLTISGSGGVQSATTERNNVDGGSDVGTWESCTATGQFTAHCDWRSTWNDATKTVDRHGTVDATISADGKTIQCVSYEQTNAGTSYQNPGDVIWKNKSGPWYLSSMNSGAVWNSTFSRR